MKIPSQMQEIYDDIGGMIVQYCEKYLSEEYKTLCLRLLEKLCRKRPSPLLSGKKNTWAAGIVYAIAANNFIFDKSMPIHRTADELSRPFGIAPSTAGNKASEIRNLVRMSPWDTEWMLTELVDESNLKIASFPKKSENDELFSSRKKQWCRTTSTTALKHRPAEPFGAGAIRTPLVLCWCYTTHKCDKKAIKVVFLVVSGILNDWQNVL
ncbi:MAG: DUF6398 domain-containing protein [Firmicutes bacterium]|nr:DUF6398 domain-containing protein [Bacillota bacterium]